MRYDTIYLSPHLDDAVLSCGGRIATERARGERVLVVTLAAGEPPVDEGLSPLAASLHAQWGAGSELLAVRRAEDARACARLGADHLHWDVLDCIYRTAPDGRPLACDVRSLYRPLDERDRETEEECRKRLVALPPHDRLVAPLAVGGHVDHRLARRIAEAAASGAAPQDTAFYEDFPYVLKWRALGKALGRKGDWRAEVIPLAEEHLVAKIEAIAAYATQVPSLFPGEGRLAKDVRAWARKVGGERVWRRVRA